MLQAWEHHGFCSATQVHGARGCNTSPSLPTALPYGSLSHLILLRNHETTDTFSLAEEAWCGFMQIPLQRRSTRQNILKSSFQNHRWAGRQQSCVPMGRRPASPRLLVPALPLPMLPAISFSEAHLTVGPGCEERMHGPFNFIVQPPYSQISQR